MTTDFMWCEVDTVELIVLKLSVVSTGDNELPNPC